MGTIGRSMALYGFILFLVVVTIGCSPSTDDTAVLDTSEQMENEREIDVISNDTRKESLNIPTNAIPAKVVRVIDGDTFEAVVQGKTEKVRMILVDTPETVHPNKPVEPFGPEASAFTKDRLEDADVYLEFDVQERDQYGRLLAYVWTDGKLYNKLLLENGLARVAAYPPNVKYVDEFRVIQKKAQEKGVGIWSIENYVQREKRTAKNMNNASLKSAIQQPVSKGGADCTGPQIKGNINSRGEKIYHVPGGQFYDRTIPEEWFCTEGEAQAAGYRPSKR